MVWVIQRLSSQRSRSPIGVAQLWIVRLLTHMERVAFITVDTGDDLVLSFAVQCQDDASEIESLILMRTPKYEFILEEYERGVTVSFGHFEEDDLLQKFNYSAEDGIVYIQTKSRKYELDVHKVDVSDIMKMRKLLKKMNYDQSFQTSGV